jgi:hypothetical protein
MASQIEITSALYDATEVDAFAEEVLDRQVLSFYERFGRLPSSGEPVFFVPGCTDPEPQPYPEVLARVVGHIMAESDLGFDSAEYARPFAVLVLLRLGLPNEVAEEALRQEGRFLLH